MKLSLRVWLARQEIAEKRFARRSRKNDADADRYIAQQFAALRNHEEVPGETGGN